MPKDRRFKFEEDIERWIENGWLWLYSYDESALIPPKALVAFMAVVQSINNKVRKACYGFPCLKLLRAGYAAYAEVCADKIRDWRR